MAVIDTTLVAREAMNTPTKRTASWPSENAGVMVVFCIVFLGMQRPCPIRFPALFLPSSMAMTQDDSEQYI